MIDCRCMLGLLALWLPGCSPPTTTPAQLAVFPDTTSELIARCDTETVPELKVLCDQEVAVRLAAAGDTTAASARCDRSSDPMWAAECHFLVAEVLAGANLLDGALSECLLAPTFLVSCIEHVAMLQEVPRSPNVTTADIRRYTDQADEISHRRLSRLPAHLRGPLRDWLRLGRVQAWVLGQGPPPDGFGEGRSELATIERTVRAMEAARGMRPGAPYSTARAAYNGTGTWPATSEPLLGCIALAEPVAAALGPRTPVWGNTWRRVGQSPEEDAEIALLVGMFWAGTTDLPHLQATVQRDQRTAVVWTALHLARHLVVEADEGDLRDLLAHAARHPDPAIRAYAQKPLPAVNPLPRRCVGKVPGQEGPK